MKDDPYYDISQLDFDEEERVLAEEYYDQHWPEIEAQAELDRRERM